MSQAVVHNTAAPPPDTAFSVVLTLAQLETVVSCLGDLPYRVAAPIVDSLRAQVRAAAEHSGAR